MLLNKHEDNGELKNMCSLRIDGEKLVSDVQIQDLKEKGENIEVEIKVKINETEIPTLLGWLESNSIFDGEESHKEIYFNNPRNTFKFQNHNGFVDANDYLRIREVTKKETDCTSKKVAFKRVHRDQSSGENMYCDETEFEIGDFQKARLLFNQLGFVEETEISKVRKKYSTSELEFCVDEVNGIGVFLEIEAKKAFNTSTSVKGLTHFLSDVIGIKSFKKQSHGYVSMVWNPKYDFSM
jgi:adenylate cyclase class 2